MGPLCAACSNGYAAVGSGADLECNLCEGNATLTIAVGFGSIGLLVVAVVVWCYRSAKGGSEQTLIDLDNMERQSERARALSERAQVVTDFAEKLQPYAKIFLAYFQVAGGLSFAFRLLFPPLFTVFMTNCKNILSLDVISLMPIGCMTKASNFHYSMLVYTFVPFAIMVLMVLAYGVLSRGDASSKKLANKIFSAFLGLSFIILPSVSIKVFSNFACHEFDGDYGNFLKVDYSIDCEGTEHKVFSFYALACIGVYPFGIPFMYFWMLRKERR